MGFVCFKNLCMIIIFILLTTYYISAFRLIHTHAELPETETKKDLKEHVKRAYTLKDHDHREHKNQSVHVKLEGFETEITPEKKVKTMQPTRTPDTLKDKIKEGLKSKDVEEEEKPKIKIIQKDTQGKSKFVAFNEDSKEETQKSSKNIKESKVKVTEDKKVKTTDNKIVKTSDDKKVKSKEESSKIVKELFTKQVEDPTKSKIKIIQKDTEGKSKFVPVKDDVKIEIKKPSKEDTTKSKPKPKPSAPSASESKTISKEESSKIVKELYTKKEEPSKPKMKIIQKDMEGKAKFVSVTDKSKAEISKVIKKEAPKTPPPAKASKTETSGKIIKEPPASQKKNSNFKRT